MNNNIKAALRGEPSYVWRDGQERRFEMIKTAAGERINSWVLDNGCGIGLYSIKLSQYSHNVVSLELDIERAIEAHNHLTMVGCAESESLPFNDQCFDLILSHEVLEHVKNDQKSINEMVRVLKKNGLIVLFVPNKGYPFETHGIYWRGKYHFGNKPLINYLPGSLRNKLAPHVRIYTRSKLNCLFSNLPVSIVSSSIIFGAYDNIIARYPKLGKIVRSILHFLEKTPLRIFGLSHLWIIKKT